MNNATITMPFDEFEAMRRNEQFWQDRFNTLYKVIRKYVIRDEIGLWTIGDSDIVNLANDIEKYMNDYED